MSALRWSIGAALAIVATLGLVRLSYGSYLATASESAVLRLSWRAVGERIEECRTLSEEELAALPLHMRRSEICEGRLAPFRLVVAVDGETLLDAPVRASGAREDRPTYVFHEFPLPPGRHHVEVRFAVDHPAGAGASPFRVLSFDGDLELAPRTVALVTHVEGAEGLSIVSPPRGGPEPGEADDPVGRSEDP